MWATKSDRKTDQKSELVTKDLRKGVRPRASQDLLPNGLTLHHHDTIQIKDSSLVSR